jgi:hypothetical protein
MQVEVRPSATGGGRGVFAIEAIARGTVISREDPFFVLEAEREGELLHVQLAAAVLAGGLRTPAQRTCFEELHPVALSEVDAAFGEAHHSAAVDGLVATYRCSRAEALTALLRMQFNVFESGLYADQARINHRCRSNCVKLTFPGVKGSFVFATEDISADAEITVSYLGLHERSWLSRSRAMRQQHNFDVELPSLLGDVDPQLPEATAERVCELELRMDGMEMSLEEWSAVLAELSQLVAPEHVAVTRCHLERIRCVLASEDLQIEAALVGLRSCVAIANRLKPGSPSAADLAEDTESLLSFLLANGAKQLYAAFPEEFGTYAKASGAEFRAKKAKMTIRKTYGL